MRSVFRGRGVPCGPSASQQIGRMALRAPTQRSHEIVLVGVGSRCGARREAEFREDVADVAGHPGERVLPAEPQEPLVAGGVELQQRRAVLKALRPFGPTLGRVFALYGKYGRGRAGNLQRKGLGPRYLYHSGINPQAQAAAGKPGTFQAGQQRGA